MAISEGTVFWITGLAGSGKSTIGKLLTEELRKQGRNVLFLDGDALREVSPQFGYTRADRLQVGMQNGRLCKLLVGQGTDIVIATIALFHQVHQWNHKHIKNYCEIYLKVPASVLFHRDQKGLYSQCAAGKINNVMGFDISPEEPEKPHIVLENHGDLTPESGVDKVLTCPAARSHLQEQ